MFKPDFADFRAFLDRCAVVYSKPKPSDDLVETYWDALKDVPWSVVKRCGDSHLRYGKFFPKPNELRPKEDKPGTSESPGARAALEAAIARNTRNWDVYLAESPGLAKWKLLAAYLARVDQDDPSSPVYAERLEYCRSMAKRLRDEYGTGICHGDAHAMHVVSRLLHAEIVFPPVSIAPQ